MAEAASGLMVLNAAGATGPVALDQAGTLLAYAGPSGQVAIRDVRSGERSPLPALACQRSTRWPSPQTGAAWSQRVAISPWHACSPSITAG